MEFALKLSLFFSMLMTDLIKNAILSSSEGKSVLIAMAFRSIVVKNFAGKSPLISNQLFKRVRKDSSNKKSTGLGTAISKTIANKYGLGLNCNLTGRHKFTVRFPSE